MPWFSPWSDFSDLIKKKVCRYLLQRYLGNFMEEKLTLEQLNIDITNGTGTVNNVNLYCEVRIIFFHLFLHISGCMVKEKFNYFISGS